MELKKYPEEQPVLAQYEELFTAANDLQTLAGSSDLMSCGGMHLPTPQSIPLKDTIQILTLPTHFPSAILLKNGSFVEEDLEIPAAASNPPEDEHSERNSFLAGRRFTRVWQQ